MQVGLGLHVLLLVWFWILTKGAIVPVGEVKCKGSRVKLPGVSMVIAWTLVSSPSKF